MWPPPAPPEYVDHTQLPASLRRPSLVPEQRGDDDEADVNESAGTPLMRRQSSVSEAGPAATTASHTLGQREFHRSTEMTDSQLTRPHSELTNDRQPEASRDREASHQLKRSSASDHEPGVQAKRLSDGVAYDGSQPAQSVVGGQAGMDVDRSGEAESSARRGHFHGSDVDQSGTRYEPETASTVSREEVEPCGGGVEGRAVPPRLMETGVSDEPMVIEFSAAGVGSGSGEDEVSVRAGHKRARVNSDAVHNDVVKKSFVKRPITFYGKHTSLDRLFDRVDLINGLKCSSVRPSVRTNAYVRLSTKSFFNFKFSMKFGM